MKRVESKDWKRHRIRTVDYLSTIEQVSKDGLGWRAALEKKTSVTRQREEREEGSLSVLHRMPARNMSSRAYQIRLCYSGSEHSR